MPEQPKAKRRTSPPPKAGKDPRQSARRDPVETEIIDKAEELFAERGFAGTNLAEVAQAAGLSRAALYHYVRSKEDLLSKVLARVSQTSVDQLTTVIADLSTATDSLRAIAYNSALTQASEPSRMRMVLRSESHLPPELAASYDDGRRRVLELIAGIIEDGIRRGEFRPVDSRLAALGVIGMCNWVTWWYRPGSSRSPEAVAAALADMAVASLAGPDEDIGEGDAVRRAMKRLRQDVAYLDRVLSG